MYMGEPRGGRNKGGFRVTEAWSNDIFALSVCNYRQTLVMFTKGDV